MDDMITINELIWKLKKCIRPAYELLCQIGYDEHLELYGLVEKDETDPNTNYKVKAVDEILLNLYKAHDSLRFLQGREGREVYKVTRMPGKRYGYQDKDGRQVDFCFINDYVVIVCTFCISKCLITTSSILP